MAVIIFIIGACLGSFYLVVGKRLPKNEDIILSRSKCDSCNHTLFWYDLIPIFSYIFLLGKCRYCHKKISITNLLIEISMGLLFSIGYIYMGFSYRYFIYLILISLMILIFITDFLYSISIYSINFKFSIRTITIKQTSNIPFLR